MFRDSALFEFRGPFGIPVQIGSSIIFLAFLFLSVGGDPAYIAYDIVFLLILILSIFLHELGHAWGCRVQGVSVRRIMIYGGGGFCEHDPATRSEDELIVAMGPIVNLALWAICSLLTPYAANPDLSWALEAAADVNIILAVLNMLPVMPLDGGQLFQLALMRILPAPLATRICGGVGLLIALAWIPMMIACMYYFGFFLLFFPPIALHWQMLRLER